MRLFTRFNPLLFLAFAGAFFAASVMLSGELQLLCQLLTFCAMAFAALGFVLQANTLRLIQSVCHDVARGDMERRVILPHTSKNLRGLSDAVNRLIDVADAYIRESSASSEHAAKGLFYRTILPTGLNGAWRKVAENLNAASTAIRQNLINTSRSAGEKLEASVMKTINTLDGATQALVHTGSGLGDIANKSSGEAATLSESTKSTTQNVSNIAAAVEEMTAAVKEISQQVHQMNRLAQETSEESKQASTTLQALEKSTIKISEIAELINGIASQVNLLALNATIEAARAGDAGKGFAVVASEVKNLAKRTSDATSEVEQVIQVIKSDVANTTNVLQAILNKVTSVHQASSVIAAAVEEQNATTLEISANLQRTSSTVQHFSGSVQSMAETSQHTQKAAQNMQNSTTMLSEICQTLKQDVRSFLQMLAA